MKKIEYKSQCCNAPVKVEGLPDFERDECPCTTYYVCTKCNEACDVIGTKKNLLARFLDAIVVNAKEHPENLYTSKEVWDEEWAKLLDRPARIIPKLKKLFESSSVFKKSIKRGIKDIEEGEFVPAETVFKEWEEVREWEKRHPVLTKFKRIWWWVRYGIKNKVEEIPLRVKTFVQRGKRGWANSDTWGFDYYLADIISKGVEHLIKYGNHKVHSLKAFKQIAKTFNTAKKISEGDLMYIPSKDFKWKDYKKYKRDCAKMREKHASKDRVMTKRESLEFEKGFDTFKEKFFRLWD